MTVDFSIAPTNYIPNVNPTSVVFELEEPYILMVEDDPVLGKVLSQALEKRGLNLKVVADGQTAVRLLESEVKPCLVLLDLVLPIYNGYEILNLIRSTPGWKEIPVIVMSSKSKEEDIATAFDRGANDYLMKPVNFKELFNRICSYSEKLH
jgi:DNA-binding response OmpR family regulator